jgi:hypothetical protein
MSAETAILAHRVRRAATPAEPLRINGLPAVLRADLPPRPDLSPDRRRPGPATSSQTTCYTVVCGVPARPGRRASPLHPQPNSPQSYPTRKLSWLIRDCRQWPLPMIAGGVRPLRSGNPSRRLPPSVPQASPVPALTPWPCRPGPLPRANRRLHPFLPTPSSPCARHSSGPAPLCVPATPMAGRRGPGSPAVAVPMCLGRRGRSFRRPELRIPCGRWSWARTAISPSSQPPEANPSRVRPCAGFLRERRDPTDPAAAPECFDDAGDRTP